MSTEKRIEGMGRDPRPAQHEAILYAIKQMGHGWYTSQGNGHQAVVDRWAIEKLHQIADYFLQECSYPGCDSHGSQTIFGVDGHVCEKHYVNFRSWTVLVALQRQADLDRDQPYWDGRLHADEIKAWLGSLIDSGWSGVGTSA